MSNTPTPLAGLTVVEFTHMVMGPTVGHILAGLGAEVIRVEPIGGDQTRRLLGSGAGYFPMYNRHKASVCLDLKSEDGLAVAGGQGMESAERDADRQHGEEGRPVPRRRKGGEAPGDRAVDPALQRNEKIHAVLC